jgi:hypothetical protein
MKGSILDSIQQIRDINKKQHSFDQENIESCFEYKVNTTGYEIANGGINQLISNLPFTLLINQQITSVKIIRDKETAIFTLNEIKDEIEEISLIHLDKIQEGIPTKGLLYNRYDELVIAIPTIKNAEGYSIVKVEEHSQIYKEFPLIGTENFNIPILFQHSHFKPNEQRDGVRTKIADGLEEDTDNTAHLNREAFREMVIHFSSFTQNLVTARVSNLHLLAESGLPPNLEIYYDKKWYQSDIQNPLRSIVLTHSIVDTVSGNNVPISNGVFFIIHSFIKNFIIY